MMSKNVVEPLGIALIFTTATIGNRRRESDLRYEKLLQPESSRPDERTPLLQPPHSLPPQPKSHSLQHWLPYPDTRQFHNNIPSRILRKFPFLLEIWYWALTYWPYQLARARTAVWINSDPDRKAAIFAQAERNAIRVLRIEEWLSINIEHGLQHFILTRCRYWVMTVLCDVYLSHIAVGVAFLGYAYTCFPREQYQRVRRSIFLNNILAFLIMSLYRCTPPRLMPSSHHFVDVLHPNPSNPGATPPSDWANNRFQLTIAAMPSLHFGTALLIGLSVARWGTHLWFSVLGYLYPVLMFVVVISTANHWVLDCVAGLCVVGLGWGLNWVVLLLVPVEQWCLWVLRVEKPGEVMRISGEDVQEGNEVVVVS
ncbi:uncharacterized protein LY89DRAFT_354453 [Mollisia scopiformis]|uniref:Inositolphosphotransferase Aur1/Ipt1 domain-containing protein n=1 Tax=Mollisia scopiformis TaxID=149040 RepID=A0A132B4W2_MOLSC|nr:uncharacterized protein LY89DRAFT_354453 [Mollisia scopiformis]KUJ07445.1 hypothetical protein LY89DRAFT_354453 [Mollisia scopiformis]